MNEEGKEVLRETDEGMREKGDAMKRRREKRRERRGLAIKVKEIER